MAEKNYMNEEVAPHIPLYPSAEFDPNKEAANEPPAYESPRIDFSSGWKDRGFGIAFWIHCILVTIIGMVLGVPAVVPMFKSEPFKEFKNLPPDFDFKPIFYGFGAAIGVAVLASFATFSILQCCSGSLIRCSYGVILAILTALVAGIFVLVPLPISIGVAFLPMLMIIILLIAFLCVRKRIPFAEAHLKAGVAALHTHPSLILIALAMILAQIVWFILWLLMTIGIQSLVSGTPLIPNLGPNTPTDNQTTITTTTTTTTAATIFYSTTRGSNEKSFNFSYNFLQTLNQHNKTNGTSDADNADGWINMIVKLLLLFSWYWGTITLSNIPHFVAACSVGQWWFAGGENEQYQFGTSVKRAFTTNFGTICLGSLFEAIIKAVRSSNENRRKQNIVSCIFGCILQILEKIIGYMNEWGFIYAALTGEGFVQSSKKFIELFKSRGWTMVINDSLIGGTLNMINFAIGMLSSFAGGVIIYLLMPFSQVQIVAIIIVSIISLLVGIFMSSVITTILKSCVRSVFVCFALNPAALGASHPDHLETLSNAWHKVYPNEFASSGYAKYYRGPIV